jgi:hypothetical protein
MYERKGFQEYHSILLFLNSYQIIVKISLTNIMMKADANRVVHIPN